MLAHAQPSAPAHTTWPSVPRRGFAAAAGAWARASCLGLGVTTQAVCGAVTPQTVQIPAPHGLTLRAQWFAPAHGARPVATIVGLHGCGGLYDSKGQLSERYTEFAERYTAQGYALIYPDSWGSRGLKSQCSTRYNERTTHVSDRVDDVRATLAWVAQQSPDARQPRAALLGWSNGGTTTLHTLAALKPGEVAAAAVFYPGCRPLLERRTAVAPIPLLMQLGADDDWTPAQPCQDWASWLKQTQPQMDLTVKVYAGAVHGFDGTQPVRVRTNVPNGVNGHSVKQGGHPEARGSSLRELDAFWQRTLGTPAQPKE